MLKDRASLRPAPAEPGPAESRRIAKPRLASPPFSDIVRLGAGDSTQDRDFPVTSRDLPQKKLSDYLVSPVLLFGHETCRESAFWVHSPHYVTGYHGSAIRCFLLRLAIRAPRRFCQSAPNPARSAGPLQPK